MKPKEIFSHTYEVINKARALQILHFGSSWELRGSLPKSVPLDFGLAKTFAS